MAVLDGAENLMIPNFRGRKYSDNNLMLLLPKFQDKDIGEHTFFIYTAGSCKYEGTFKLLCKCSRLTIIIIFYIYFNIFIVT